MEKHKQLSVEIIDLVRNQNDQWTGNMLAHFVGLMVEALQEGAEFHFERDKEDSFSNRLFTGDLCVIDGVLVQLQVDHFPREASDESTWPVFRPARFCDRVNYKDHIVKVFEEGSRFFHAGEWFEIERKNEHFDHWPRFLARRHTTGRARYEIDDEFRAEAGGLWKIVGIHDQFNVGYNCYCEEYKEYCYFRETEITRLIALQQSK